MPIVRVALDIPLSTLFDYLVGAELSVEVGQRVIVPFGRKQVVGVVMELAESSELTPGRIKSVERVLDDVAPLPFELLKLLRFCSDYYHYALGMTVMSALPLRLRTQEPMVNRQESGYILTASGKGLDMAQFPKRRVVQQRILQTLQQGMQSATQLRNLSSSAAANLKILQDAGWIEAQAMPETAALAHRFQETYRLTTEQQQAVDAVKQTSGYACFLLHGITGSGKTEVYVHLMNRVLQGGGQILLLVPEINLTPQLENYFRSRFPDTELVSLHSGLSDGERVQKWLRAQSGHARIVLGTRLAV